MIDAALFDYDGTLANTDGVHHACWNRALAEATTAAAPGSLATPLAIDDAFYAAHASGVASPEVAATIAAHFPDRLPANDAPALAARKDTLYDAWIAAHTLPLMAGAREILAYLRERRVPLAIVTGAPRSAIQQTLIDHGILDWFDAIITRDEVTHGKPHPEGYRLGLRALGVDATRAVAFEDTGSGVRAAHAAGLTVYAIPSPYALGHDHSAADAVCADLHAALRHLRPRVEG